MTLTVRKADERGHFDHGWLDTYHTFSFADYRDPAFDSFGPLRVINQDRVQPGRGFATHGHRDMEIVTYVLRGTLAHRDDMGNGSEIRAGEVQLMSAGTGVRHSEFNASETDEVELLQMWVIPSKTGTRPRYEQRAFSNRDLDGRLALAVSPSGRDGSLTVGQDVSMYVGRLAAGQKVALRLGEKRRAWVHVGLGRTAVNGVRLSPGDGAAVTGETELHFDGDGAELVVFDLPEDGR